MYVKLTFRGEKMFKKISIRDAVTLYVRPTKQFKTVTTMFEWETPYNEHRAAHRAVLSNVLQDSTQQFPTYRALKQQLDDLYGVSLFTDVQMKGNSHRFVLFSEAIHEKYTQSSTYFDQWWKMIEEMIFSPNVKEGTFDEATVKREKHSIVERMASIYEYKERYARKRLLEWMRPNDPASQSKYGTEKAVEEVTAASLYKEYERMLKEDALNIYIVGDVDSEAIERRIREQFPLHPEKKDILPYEATAERPKYHYIREQQKMTQSQLQIGYRLPVYYHDEDFFTMQVANGILGGFSHSKLFLNVREKESLAYSISSGYSSRYGLLFISAGIDPEDEEKALTLIDLEMTKMQHGAIVEKELNQTKKQLKNGLKNAFDTARGQIFLYEQFEPLLDEVNAETIARNWENVTLADVQRVMEKASLEMIYVLGPKGEVRHENKSN